MTKTKGNSRKSGSWNANYGSSIYVTGFDPKKVNKCLLKELFMQGGPVRRITTVRDFAFVDFDDPESGPFCLAMFKDVELFGQALVMRPNRSRSKEDSKYLKELDQMRLRLRDEYSKLPLPDLPPPVRPEQKENQLRKNHRKNKRYGHRQNPSDKNDTSVSRKERRRSSKEHLSDDTNTQSALNKHKHKKSDGRGNKDTSFSERFRSSEPKRKRSRSRSRHSDVQNIKLHKDRKDDKVTPYRNDRKKPKKPRQTKKSKVRK